MKQTHQLIRVYISLHPRFADLHVLTSAYAIKLLLQLGGSPFNVGIHGPMPYRSPTIVGHGARPPDFGVPGAGPQVGPCAMGAGQE